MNIDDVGLLLTCGACPEQYSAYANGEHVAYLRLRYGSFYASVPDTGGEIIYESEPDGFGMFNDDERDKYLNAAKQAICDYYNKQVKK